VVGFLRSTYFGTPESRAERMSVIAKPQVAATAATGSATLKVSVISGWRWFIAPKISKTKQRKATEVKKEITPVTKAIAKLRKRVRMKTNFGCSTNQPIALSL